MHPPLLGKKEIQSQIVVVRLFKVKLYSMFTPGKNPTQNKIGTNNLKVSRRAYWDPCLRQGKTNQPPTNPTPPPKKKVLKKEGHCKSNEKLSFYVKSSIGDPSWAK